MIKEYLRHNRRFRQFAGPFIRGMARLRRADINTVARNYRESVQGGTLLVAPKNIAGQFEVSAISDIASRVAFNGAYEPEVTAVLSKLELDGGTIVNIGANVGFYSVYLANAFPTAARILSVEPNPEAFHYLTKNIQRNNLSARIHPIQACIGDSEGSIELAVIDGMPEYSSIGGIVHPSVADRKKTTVRVPVLPLSAIVGLERVSLIFVDTEGAEAIVFNGAKDILLRDKPILFFECSDTLLRKFGSSTKELERQLQDLGYKVNNGLSRRLPLQHPFEGEGIAIHSTHLK